ncbi:MAG: hypothetical protein IPM64_09430 [Phycisphaerales bacterium]|nr:hypothetical protein [Phycisphaerales bacterium]
MLRVSGGPRIHDQDAALLKEQSHTVGDSFDALLKGQWGIGRLARPAAYGDSPEGNKAGCRRPAPLQ